MAGPDVGEQERAAGTRTLVLGIGNILWGDEGFGVRAVEAFHRAYAVSDDVTVMDGGTQGLYLVNFVEEADQLLVFDAIDYALAPGTLKIVRDAEVPKFTGAKKMSLHQTGFQEVLSAADLLGRYPRKLALVGCQPLDLEAWGGPLTDPVRNAIAPALDAAIGILAEWGVAVRPCVDGAGHDGLLAHDIDAEGYERRTVG
jgi:hydrogenase maturation protease